MEQLNMNLEQIRLFRGRMAVSLPEGFRDMPDYLARKKYPSKYRPPVILMDAQNLVNVTFHLMEQPLPETQLEKAMKALVRNLKQTFPQANFDEITYADRKGGRVAWIPYAGMAMDADIFYIVFLTPLNGKVLYGSFNCPLEMRGQWEDVAVNIIGSIVEGEEG